MQIMTQRNFIVVCNNILQEEPVFFLLLYFSVQTLPPILIYHKLTYILFSVLRQVCSFLRCGATVGFSLMLSALSKQEITDQKGSFLR